MLSRYPRNMAGYGREPPTAGWPGGARIAVQFVINYEEGAERSVLNGDATAEHYLGELAGTPPPAGRDPGIESVYEYGSRAGYWRLHRLFTDAGVPVTVFGVSQALALNPEAVASMREAGWEIACHGYRWIDYRDVPMADERAQIAAAVELHEKLTGARPLGWYTGRASEHTRRLVVEQGGFLYDADSYADDLPYWDYTHGPAHLVVPYTLDNNDMRFALANGFASGDQFWAYLKDAFDVLYREGADTPKMMSIGLHCRLAGRPGRVAALTRFVDYACGFPDAWICRRVDIARHWHAHHPPRAR